MEKKCRFKPLEYFKTLLLIVSLWLTSTSVGAQEAYAVLSEDKSVLTFYYDTQKTTRGGMSVGPFESVGWTPNVSWYDQRHYIKTAVFDASFAKCTSLTSTAYWFDDCYNLTTITGTEYLKTDNVTDMRNMFNGCTILLNVDVSGFNTSSVTNMRHMFLGCYNLKNLDVSGFDTSNVTDMGGMFGNCSSLTSLDLRNFDTSNVKNMYNMFLCTSVHLNPLTNL